MENIDEIWKIHELTGLVVSNKGRVITCRGKHITYGSDRGNGYKCICFKKKSYSVHRLVAETFIENPNNYPCVNHKDEDKTNNSVGNLEWCNHRYNVNYGTARQRMIEKQRNDPNQSKTVYQYTKQGVLVKEWASTQECGRNGFDQGHVASCCRGELKTHKGFIWSYEYRI